MRTTFAPPARWERMKAMASTLVTPTGVFSTTEKKTLRSKATAKRVLGRARAVRNSRYSSTSG
jgi:hypothetical protein